MTDFQYTDSLKNIDSSAVKQAYYNTHDKTLVVVMRSNGNAYRYDGVPSWVWSEFTRSSSKGTTFATKIKPSYGPSKFLGVGSRLNFAEYSVTAPSMASPRYPLTVAQPPVAPGRRAAVGTPKALTDNTSAFAEAFPSKTWTSVKFQSAGGVKTATFKDISEVSEALKEIQRLADILGLDNLKVKEVTTHFE